MTESINVITKDLGIIDGLQTFEVINADTGETIGFNQNAPEEQLLITPEPTALDSALAKLTKLGLTEEEARAIVGLS